MRRPRQTGREAQSGEKVEIDLDGITTRIQERFLFRQATIIPPLVGRWRKALLINEDPTDPFKRAHTECVAPVTKVINLKPSSMVKGLKSPANGRKFTWSSKQNDLACLDSSSLAEAWVSQDLE